MKAFFVTTSTNETQKHYESFLSLGNEVELYIYNNSRKAEVCGERLDNDIYAKAKKYAPDLIVYVGAAGGNTPSIAAFLKLKAEVAPTVHLCSDAADFPWWPYLQEYDKAGCFSVQVALDGAGDWPLKEGGISALTPFNPALFPAEPMPHIDRPIVFGFAGAFGQRGHAIEQMQTYGLQPRKRDSSADSYPAYLEHLSNSRIVVNFARTGSGQHMHIKGRVIESALCGAMVLEERGSPLSQWFELGVDFMDYKRVKESASIVESLKEKPEVSQEMAFRLRQKILDEHSPKPFWGRIFERLN